jgi:hypothetical protein
MTKANEYTKLKTPLSQSALNDLLSFHFQSCIVTTILVLSATVLIGATSESLVVAAVGIGARWGAHFDFKRALKRAEG